MSVPLPASVGANAGFTLVEVLMALLVLTVGLLGLLQSVNVAYQHNLRNRLREQAVLLGEEQMLVLRKCIATGDPFRNATTSSRLIAGVSRSFTIRRESLNLGTTGSCRLRVSVQWRFKESDLKHVVYSLKKK